MSEPENKLTPGVVPLPTISIEEHVVSTTEKTEPEAAEPTPIINKNDGMPSFQLPSTGFSSRLGRRATIAQTLCEETK